MCDKTIKTFGAASGDFWYCTLKFEHSGNHLAKGGEVGPLKKTPEWTADNIIIESQRCMRSSYNTRACCSLFVDHKGQHIAYSDHKIGHVLYSAWLDESTTTTTSKTWSIDFKSTEDEKMGMEINVDKTAAKAVAEAALKKRAEEAAAKELESLLNEVEQAKRTLASREKALADFMAKPTIYVSTN